MCAGGVRLVILACSRVFFHLRVASVSPFFFFFFEKPSGSFFFLSFLEFPLSRTMTPVCFNFVLG